MEEKGLSKAWMGREEQERNGGEKTGRDGREGGEREVAA